MGNLLKMQSLESHLPEVLTERPGIGPRNLHLKPGYPDTYCFRDSPTRNLCFLVAGVRGLCGAYSVMQVV